MGGERPHAERGERGDGTRERALVACLYHTKVGRGDAEEGDGGHVCMEEGEVVLNA